MKHSIFTFFILLLISSNIIAQEVITSGGDYFDNGNISVSWTLGEPVTETITDGTNILTQGFQQSKLSASVIFTVNSEDYSISVFPNPTEKLIYLKTDNPNNLKYQFIDINGKLIKEKKITSDVSEIHADNLPASMYFLKIFKKNQLIKTFQIVKQ